MGGWNIQSRYRNIVVQLRTVKFSMGLMMFAPIAIEIRADKRARMAILQFKVECISNSPYSVANNDRRRNSNYEQQQQTQAAESGTREPKKSQLCVFHWEFKVESSSIHNPDSLSLPHHHLSIRFLWLQFLLLRPKIQRDVIFELRLFPLAQRQSFIGKPRLFGSWNEANWAGVMRSSLYQNHLGILQLWGF